MSLLAHLSTLRDAHERLVATGRDPFSVRFDRILSATEAILNGRETILLGTNNYLGLTFDERCIDEAVMALRREGTGTTGSRVANGTYAGHSQLEQRLAAFFGRRSAMVFTTGYQANLGILSTVAGPADHVLIDADSHASIYDGCALGRAKVTRFRHNDPKDLDRRLRRIAREPGAKLIVTEGIFSMLGDTAPLKEIAAVKRDYGAFLLVDEAHSLGVLGAHGRGQAEAAGVEPDVDFVVGTFSKSLGSVGGFCVSDHPEFNVLRIACRAYMFTASLPPSVIASVTQALGRLEETPALRHSLRAKSQYFYRALADAGFSLGSEPSPIVAVQLPSPDIAVAFWSALLDNGVYMNLALPPATPNHMSLLRSSLSAAHTRAQLDRVIALFIRLGRKFEILPELVHRAQVLA
jgi:8-amino-7-oxononanoate synthase